ncbi:hypothetical protein CEXT_623081 [Caerostris extrusa]|uniref:Uncharacterized protein n=1 Tax=Caerostris extrusa TaxID=172846 RepID=A0AAV4N2Q1_CAEEX|nr:hypothetical protein CEXT_623081 [Caerostris extrusa]
MDGDKNYSTIKLKNSTEINRTISFAISNKNNNGRSTCVLTFSSTLMHISNCQIREDSPHSLQTAFGSEAEIDFSECNESASSQNSPLTQNPKPGPDNSSNQNIIPKTIFCASLKLIPPETGWHKGRRRRKSMASYSTPWK